MTDKAPTSLLQLLKEKKRIEIESEIRRLSAKYPMASKKGKIKKIWALLAKVDKNFRPIYSVESAMRKVDEKEKSLLRKKQNSRCKG